MKQETIKIHSSISVKVSVHSDGVCNLILSHPNFGDHLVEVTENEAERILSRVGKELPDVEPEAPEYWE